MREHLQFQRQELGLNSLGVVFPEQLAQVRLNKSGLRGVGGWGIPAHKPWLKSPSGG